MHIAGRLRNPSRTRQALVATALLGLLLPFLQASRASALRQGAVDNDPANKLWDCETRRVPFGNAGSDVLRCFTFRYAVPAGGITSAYLHVSVKPDGDQDTDQLVLAVERPAGTDCALGAMPGCVVLHGGLSRTQVSLNINLLDIGCDGSIKRDPALQAAVVSQLASGVLHLMLQDDTAVNSAELVLNEGPSSIDCGATDNPTNPATGGSGSGTPSTSGGSGATGANGTAQVRAERPSYTTDEPVTLVFSGMPGTTGSAYDWISIVKAGAADDSWYDWRNLGGEREGRRDFGRLPAGSYEARAYFDWGGKGGYTVQARSTFTVGGAPPTTSPPACAAATGAIIATPPIGTPEPLATTCMTLQAGQRSVRAGDEVIIPVWVINGKNVANINFEMAYDDGVAQAQRVTKRSSFLGSALQQSNTEQPGRVLLGAAQTTGETGTGVVINVTFKAVGKPGDRTPLTLKVTTLNDPAGASLSIDRIDGLIQIVGADGLLPGDCDGNTTLDEGDALCALQMSVELRPPNTTLDVDRDSKVTSRDSAVILQRSVGRV